MVFGATIHGFRKVFASPALILAAWLLTVVAALPVTVVLGNSLQQSFGRTLSAEPMADGFDMNWFGEYRDDARGVEASFNPTVSGVGGVLSNLESLVNGGLVENFPGLIGLAILFMLAWALFVGGAIERYAFEDAPRGIAAMLNTGGRYWGRFVRLAILSGALYYGVYRLHGLLMKRVENRLIDVTEETRAMWATLTVYLVTALLLLFVRACFDYAKIAIVIEDRHSALLSAIQGAAFVVTHPLRSLGVVLLLLLVTAVPLALYVEFRPSAITPGWGGVIHAILIGQAWLVARLTLRLTLLGAQTSLYQTSSGSAIRGK